MFRLRLDRLFGGESSADRKSEVSDGVFEIRRRMLIGVPAAIALFGLDFSAIESTGADAKIAWDEYLKLCLPRALELHQNASPSGQDAYLFWLASNSARLDISSMPKGKLARFTSLDPPITTGPAYFGKPFFIIEWELAPNAYLPPHNHPNISVCTFCTDGEARIRNFHTEGALPEFKSTQAFRVRETHNELLSSGRMNLLSAVRDNVHTFKAGRKGARGFDITTYHGKDMGFSFLDIHGKPVDDREMIYEATWASIP